MKSLITFFSGIIFLIFFIHESPAVPPMPGIYETGNISGQNTISQSFPETTESISQQSEVSATGEQEIAVILIEFPDLAHNSAHDNVYFNNLIFSRTNPYSMYNYYHEVSYGQLGISGTITEWYKSHLNMIYYGADGSKADNLNAPIYELAREAVKLADSGGFGFSQYDKNRDGYIDHIIIIHSGRGQETGGGSYGPEAIWSHHWSIWPPEEVDGVLAADYSMVSEYSPVGTLAHEFGHDLGLPDLYDTDGSSQGIGLWGIMGVGSWLMGGDVPAHLCAWSKVFLGWIEPKEIIADKLDVNLNCVEQSNIDTIMKIPLTQDEYFLLENRHRIGFDQYLPGEGLLIWHIDESSGELEHNNINTCEEHKRVDLEEADGRNDLDKNMNIGDNTDPYFSSNASEFTPDTNPNSQSYVDPNINISIMNISEPGNAMNLSICLGQDSSAIQDINIDLAAGWNLISLYLQPIDTRCQAVLSSLGGKCKSVWAYDAASESWQSYIINGPPSSNNLEKMESGRGYWVIMNQPGRLSLKGTQPGDPPPLYTGWNLMGHSFQTAISIQDYLSSVGDKLDSIGTYVPQDDKWLWYRAGEPDFLNNLKFLEPGKGYISRLSK